MHRLISAPHALLIGTLLYSSFTFAQSLPALPNIGITAGSTLSISQEQTLGTVYRRMIQGNMPVLRDPVLSQYINDLGHRLVANSDNVRTPFEFLLVQDPDINAAAFFGGNVALNTGLFLHADNESQLASVIAHEIAHVTQRHLARRMEENAKYSPATLAAMIGSLALSIAAPEVGIAAMQATTAAAIQGQINYTRSNEQEADRFGMQTLANAGFDPKAMPQFFGKLADQIRYSSKPPAMLLTHPLPEERITDTISRAEQYPEIRLPTSQSFELAKVRIIVRAMGWDNKRIKNWLTRQEMEKLAISKTAQQYGWALYYLDNHQYQQAHTMLDPLLKKSPNNAFYVDAATDLDLYQKHHLEAIKRLQTQLILQPNNPVFKINLINALLENKQAKDSIPLLVRYTSDYPNDINGWYLLAKAYAQTQQRASELAARAEMDALKGNWSAEIGRAHV